MKTYFDQYSEEEIKHIVSISVSYKDFARKIGYSHSPSGDTIKTLRQKLLNYDTSHFETKAEAVERNEENIFIQNSTAAQVTLRRWYLKGNYSEYKCSICGQEPFWNGKEMSLILDHINGTNNDDTLENLRWVCPNCNSQLETTGSRNPNRKIFAKKYFCQDCGKEISKGAQRCGSCENKTRVIPEEKMPVTREKLKELIRSQSFVSIGNMFTVSDNAVRKWCDKYNLPRKKTEISRYSDEEWESI